MASYPYYQPVQASGYQYGVNRQPPIPGQPYPTVMMMPNVPPAQQQGLPRYQQMQQQTQYGAGYVPGHQHGIPDTNAPASMQFHQQSLMMQQQQPGGIQQILVPMQPSYINHPAVMNQQFNGTGSGTWQNNVQPYPNGSQQPQQQFLPHQPQQSAYKSKPTDPRLSYTPYSTPPVAQSNLQQPVPQAPQPDKRKRTPLVIQDPNTQQVVNLDDLAKPSAVQSQTVSSTDSTKIAPSSTATNNIQAEFAAKVAATLSQDSSSKAATSAQPAVSTSLPEECGSQDGSSLVKPTTEEPVVANCDKRLESDSEVVLPSQISMVADDVVDAATENIPEPSAVALSRVPDSITEEAVSKAMPVLSINKTSDAVLPTPAVSLSNETSSDSKTGSVVHERDSAEPIEHCSAAEADTTEVSSSVTLETESSTEESLGKDDKKKKNNKKKDVNAKGKAFVSGSDMDAFIDETQKQSDVVTNVSAESVTSSRNVSHESEEPPSASISSTTAAKYTTQTDKPVSNAENSDAAESSGTADATGSMHADKTDAEQLHKKDFDASIETTDDPAIVTGDKPEERAEEEINKPEAKFELKYNYPEGQWSPFNQEGKKRYDREFMMQLQNIQPSLVKPKLPPHLDIILDEPSSTSKLETTRNRSVELGRMNSMTMAPDFTPGYVKSSPSGSRRPGGQKSASIKRDGAGGSGSAHEQKKIILGLQKEVQLNKAENAWKPQLITQHDTAVDDSLATQDLYKKVRGVLNKLTPQKFQTLMEQVMTYKIDTEERLMGCIDIIFEKAISEPSYSVAYANMAKRMINLNVPRAGTEPVQMVTFRTLLLNKCQREFEKDKQDELDMAERQKLIDEADSEEKRKQLLEEQADACTKAKRRSLGNIRFIGELFKLRMLTEAIMHECLFKLLRSHDDEDNLECLCQLLTTIGQELDKKESKMQPRMDHYFKQLEGLVSDRSKVSSRIRFLILDTIDLRKNQWVQRREKNNPKTIEQIHKEAQEEQDNIKAEMQKAAIDNRMRRSMGGPPRPGVPTAGGSEDGWNTVTRPPKVVVDPNKMKLTKQQVDDNIQLGPGGRGMGTWQFGSRGGGKSAATSQSADTDRVPQVNRFSMLSNAGIDQPDPRLRSGGGGGGGRGAGAGSSLRPGRDYQGSMSGPPGRPVVRHSQERSAELSLRSDCNDLRSPASSRSASREARPLETAQREDTERPSSAMSGSMTQSTGPELSRDQIERKTKSIVEEFLHLNDLKEATECVKELDSSKSLHLFVYHSLMLNLERTQQARQRTGALLHHLVKSRVLSNSQFVEGLRSVLELAEDMVIDIPCIWTYFSELISPLVEEGGLPLVSLRNAFQPLLDCSGGDKAGVVISLVLHDAVHRLGHHRVAELWQQSGLEWSQFVPADEVTSFLEKNKLEFTTVKSSLPATRTISMDRLQDELTRIVKDSSVEDESIIDFLKENVGSEVDGKCIRALTTAMCSAALVDGDSPDQHSIEIPLVKKRAPLLHRLTNSKPELEIEVLFAVQVFIYKNGVDTSVFPSIFDMLYDEDVVTDVTFLRWKNNHLEGEQVGRGIAIRTLTQFFKWLEEDTTTS